AIFIAGRDASTLPKKMFESIRLESDPVIAVVSTLLTGAVLLGVLISLFFRPRPAQGKATSVSNKGEHMQINRLVKPRSIAIEGPRDRVGPRRSVIESPGAIGFPGPIYPVTPK